MVIFLGIFLGAVSETWARVDIKPRLTVREEYNDNIFLDSFAEESDYITTAFPAVTLLFDSNYLDLDLDYGLLFLFYLDHSELDETDPGDTQRATMKADILPDRDFTVTVLDEFKQISIDQRRAVVEENSFVNKSNLNRLWINPRYRFRAIKTFEATLGYEYEKLAYDSPEGDDSERNTASLNLQKDLWSNRVTLSTGYTYLQHSAKTTEDYRRQDVYVEGIYRINPNLTLTGDIGLTRVDFETGEEFIIKTGQVGFEVELTSRLKGSASYAEDYNVSVNEGSYKSQTATAALSYVDTFSVVLTVLGDRDRYTTDVREDRSAGGSLVLRRPLGKRFDVSLLGDWTYFKFLPENEIVHRYGGGASLDWELKYVRLGLGYRYRVNDSDIDANDYWNNIAFLEAGVEF